MARRDSAPLDDLAQDLHSAAIHLLRRLRREDDALGLTAAGASAMSVLVFAGPRTLGELAAAEQVKPPTMTRLVQALERDGLVRCALDPSDRRVVRVEATAAGARLLHEGRRRRVAALTDLLGTRTAAEVAALRTASRILTELVRAPASAPPAQRARR